MTFLPNHGGFEQVEKVFAVNHPDPMEIEKAKRVLKVRVLS